MAAKAWHQGPMLCFDTETTGTSVDFDRIVTATLVTIRPECEPVVESWLINPGVPIPAAATAVHGITDEMAQISGRHPGEVVAEIAASLRRAAEVGSPVVAFNAAFDCTVLDRECRRYGITAPEPLVIDPFIIDKKLDKWRKGLRTLTATCAHYRVALNGAHDATEDALAAGRLAWRMAQQYPELQIPLEDLHTKQAMWRHEWAAEFQDYLRTRKGEVDAVINGEWPVQPLAEGWTPDSLPVLVGDAA